MWINSECFTNFYADPWMKDFPDIDFEPASDLKKYFPGSLYSSPMALEASLLKQSVVTDLPLLFENPFSLPISAFGLLSF